MGAKLFKREYTSEEKRLRKIARQIRNHGDLAEWITRCPRAERMDFVNKLEPWLKFPVSWPILTHVFGPPGDWHLEPTQ